MSINKASNDDNIVSSTLSANADILAPQPLPTPMPIQPYGSRRFVIDGGAQAHNAIGTDWARPSVRHIPDGALGRPPILHDGGGNAHPNNFTATYRARIAAYPDLIFVISDFNAIPTFDVNIISEGVLWRNHGINTLKGDDCHFLFPNGFKLPFATHNDMYYIDLFDMPGCCLPPGIHRVRKLVPTTDCPYTPTVHSTITTPALALTLHAHPAPAPLLSKRPRDTTQA